MLQVLDFMSPGRPVSRKIENPTSRGVALIDCWIAVGGAPLHWLVTSSIKPPLDVAINPLSGSLQGIQLVLQDEAVSRRQLLGSDQQAGKASVIGIPIFDRSTWASGSRYVEEKLPVSTVWTPDNDLFIVWAHPHVQIATECIVDNSLRLYFDDEAQFIGYRMLNLTVGETQAIERAEPS